MGYVALTMHARDSNDSEEHPATQQNISNCRDRDDMPTDEALPYVYLLPIQGLLL